MVAFHEFTRLYYITSGCHCLHTSVPLVFFYLHLRETTTKTLTLSFFFFFFFLQLKGLISNLWIPNHQTLTDFRTLVLHLTTTNQYHTYCFRGNFKWLKNRILQLTGVTGGRGAPHFPRLQTTLNPKFTFPHLGQVQSPSFREAGIGKHDNFKQLNWKRQITW